MIGCRRQLKGSFQQQVWPVSVGLPHRAASLFHFAWKNFGMSQTAYSRTHKTSLGATILRQKICSKPLTGSFNVEDLLLMPLEPFGCLWDWLRQPSALSAISPVSPLSPFDFARLEKMRLLGWRDADEALLLGSPLQAFFVWWFWYP